MPAPSQILDLNMRPVPALRPGAAQRITVGAASAATTAATEDGVYRLAVSADCHFAIGANPTATTNDNFAPSGSVEYVVLRAGDKIAFIQASSGGFATLSRAS